MDFHGLHPRLRWAKAGVAAKGVGQRRTAPARNQGPELLRECLEFSVAGVHAGPSSEPRGREHAEPAGEQPWLRHRLAFTDAVWCLM